MTVHSFSNDALGELDATGVAERIASGEISAREATEAAILRAKQLQDELSFLAFFDPDRALAAADVAAKPGWPTVFAGVPTFVKDNILVEGYPMTNGTTAIPRRTRSADGKVVTLLRGIGLNPLGATAMPEFGLTATTEKSDVAPVRNPWNPGYSAGGSSGGSAAAVAAGVVPIAHGNDGGGSLRIPASACGLVGLKPTRYRFPNEVHHSRMPIRLISDGVLSRTIRDTAKFVAAAEQVYRYRKLPAIGEVTGPAARRLRIGLLTDSPTGTPTDPQIAAAVGNVATLMSAAGHHVQEMRAPVGQHLVEDFSAYWALQAYLLARFGRRIVDKDLDPARLEELTRGLADEGARQLKKLPIVLARMHRETAVADRAFDEVDVLLSPTVSGRTPQLGYLAPTESYEVGFRRLVDYVGFTPLANVAGNPSIAVPHGLADDGLPLSVMLTSRNGDERTLLEVAFEIELAAPFPSPAAGATADRDARWADREHPCRQGGDADDETANDC